MKHIFKTIFRMIPLLLLLVLLVVPLISQAEVLGGSCGATVWWQLDTDSGVLTIYGSGAMENYDAYSLAPWHNYFRQITEINVAPGIQSIGKFAFQFLTYAEKVTLPEGLTSIGIYAFQNCGVKDLTLPSSLTAIGEYAFYASSLQHITLPSTLTSIGPGAFRNTHLTEIVIPEGVTSIAAYAFKDCRYLETVTLPASLTSIGTFAFGSCYALNHIVLPAALQSCNQILSNCTSLISAGPYGSGCNIEFAPMREIPDYWFSWLPATTLIVPEGTTSIGVYAFQNCSNLQQVRLPESLQRIGVNAFNGCSNLQEINLPSGLVSIGSSALAGCSSLRSLTIPGGVKTVPASLCSNCSNLTSVVLEEGIVSITDFAFYGCRSLQRINLPHSLTAIGSSAFKYCEALWDVYYQGYKSDWDRIAISTSNEMLLRARLHGALKVTMGSTTMSADGKSIFINRPQITGNAGPVTIAYNIYDSRGNAINYFYSNDSVVAATCPYNGTYNVYIVVTDTVDNTSETVMTGWFDVTGYEEFDVSKPEWTLSDDGRSCFIFRPEVRGAKGKVTYAYNIYDQRGRPINYFYSDEKAVAATCPYNGRFNVFVVVNDEAGNTMTVMTGWFNVTGCDNVASFDLPEFPEEWDETWLEDDPEEDTAFGLTRCEEESEEVDEIPVMEYLGQTA